MSDEDKAPERGAADHPAHAGRKPARRKRSDPEWDKLSQAEKFARTAEKLECDEPGEALDEALRAIGRAARRP